MDYGGDLSVGECWELLTSDKDSVLVDVRTRAEWAFVGLPQMSDGMQPIVLQEWQAFPDMAVDGDFSTHLQQQLAKLGRRREYQAVFSLPVRRQELGRCPGDDGDWLSQHL